jgi:hypothetical protein
MSIVFAVAFIFCIVRDVHLEKQYTGDLRNRIVGARLQMDGREPYFYKWRPEDGLRYYDPIRMDTTYANAITASPFFHHLLFPIANLPERQISRIWLGMQYFLFFMCVVIAFLFSKSAQQRWAITIFAVLFLFTEAWLMLVAFGQIYIFFAFMSLLFIYFLQKKESSFFVFFAGLSFTVLLFSRPSTILFLFPCLFFIKNYSFKNRLLFFLALILFGGYSLINKNERAFWNDYRKAIAAHIKDHQSADRYQRTKDFTPVIYKNWEGWNQDSIDKAKLNYPIDLKFENGGVQEMIRIYCKKKISYTALNFWFAGIVVLLTAFFIYNSRKFNSINIISVAIFGFCLYMMSDFFSPVLRSQYYAIQWISPLFLLAACFNATLKPIYFLLVIGLIFNISNTPLIGFRHTKGEYLILMVLLWLCFSRKSAQMHFNQQY